MAATVVSTGMPLPRTTRGAVGLWTTLAVSGCSSSSSNVAVVGAADAATAVDVNNFIGGSWTGTETTTGTCGASGTTYMPVGLSFVVQGSGISYMTTVASGCTFDFSVSGDTATLTSPVTCGTAVSDGGTMEVTYTKYTLTTPDGQNLTGTFTATATSGGATCTSMGTITATR
jgi:hypothetical protein